MNPLLSVRFRRGVVSETRRTCHLVPIPDNGVIPDELVALCHERFAPGTCEQLDAFVGMPCNDCLAIARQMSTPVIERPR